MFAHRNDLTLLHPVLDLTPCQTLLFPLMERIHTAFMSIRKIPILTMLLIVDGGI